MYNAIRKAQTRVTQASFAVDVAKHFKSGNGKMGNARMADLGLTDSNGVDKGLQDVFNNIVEFDADGTLLKLNADQWPKDVRERFQYGLLRDEAQQIQRTLVGELPTWMNRPMMGLIFQFREMPLVANNKQLARSMAFADKEAVTAVVLNSMMAGLVRYSKFAALGATATTGDDVSDPTIEQMAPHKYITQFGIFSDLGDLILDTGDVNSIRDAKDLALQQVPSLGLMEDYGNIAIPQEARKKRLDAIQGATPLGNTALGDALFLAVEKMMNEWEN